MSNKELLQPRFKVIAPFPFSAFQIGDVIEPKVGNQILANRPMLGWVDLSKYPNLFKPLKWWEEREIEDMPKYVKLVKDTLSEKKGDIVKTKYICFYGDKIAINSTVCSYYLPATEEEYDKFQKTV